MQTSREGVNYVAKMVNRMNFIWRETLLEDTGIDGQIEIVVDGSVTGELLGVQVKSGRSYFERRGPSMILYTPSKNDLAYWKAYSLPVILVLHQNCDGEDEAYFVRIRQEETEGYDLLIRTLDRFDESAASKLAAIASRPMNPREYYSRELARLVRRDREVIKKVGDGQRIQFRVYDRLSKLRCEFYFEEFINGEWITFWEIWATVTVTWAELQRNLPYFDLYLHEAEETTLDWYENVRSESERLKISSDIISDLVPTSTNGAEYAEYIFDVELNDLGLDLYQSLVDISSENDTK
jgi:hypothetical protein